MSEPPNKIEISLGWYTMSSEEDSLELEQDADGEYDGDEQPNIEPSDVAQTEEEFDMTPRIVGMPTSGNYIVVKDADRITSHYMSRFERCQLRATRAEQIARSGNSMVDIVGEAQDQAEAEILNARCPLLIERPVGVRIIDGVVHQVVEYWDPKNMEFL